MNKWSSPKKSGGQHKDNSNSGDQFIATPPPPPPHAHHNQSKVTPIIPIIIQRSGLDTSTYYYPPKSVPRNCGRQTSVLSTSAPNQAMGKSSPSSHHSSCASKGHHTKDSLKAESGDGDLKDVSGSGSFSGSCSSVSSSASVSVESEDDGDEAEKIESPSPLHQYPPDRGSSSTYYSYYPEFRAGYPADRSRARSRSLDIPAGREMLRRRRFSEQQEPSSRNYGTYTIYETRSNASTTTNPPKEKKTPEEDDFGCCEFGEGNFGTYFIKTKRPRNEMKLRR